MTTARKVIEWDGHDDGDVLREIHALPPGRYVLVPENEFAVDAGDEDLDPTPEEITALDEGLAQIARGDTVSRDEFVARRSRSTP